MFQFDVGAARGGRAQAANRRERSERHLAWLILGLIAGFIASRIVNKAGEGLILDIVLGIVGAIVGGFLFSVLGASGGHRAQSLQPTRCRHRCDRRARGLPRHRPPDRLTIIQAAEARTDILRCSASSPTTATVPRGHRELSRLGQRRWYVCRTLALR
jgi:uncharacterized membrane protein YeaQ/YmgE (transglycosylase-associated protein family)